MTHLCRSYFQNTNNGAGTKLAKIIKFTIITGQIKDRLVIFFIVKPTHFSSSNFFLLCLVFFAVTRYQHNFIYYKLEAILSELHVKIIRNFDFLKLIRKEKLGRNTPPSFNSIVQFLLLGFFYSIKRKTTTATVTNVKIFQQR